MIDQKHGQGTLGDDASYNAIGQAPLPAGCLMSPEDNGFALAALLLLQWRGHVASPALNGAVHPGCRGVSGYACRTPLARVRGDATPYRVEQSYVKGMGLGQ
jgi:hypothetical protein